MGQTMDKETREALGEVRVAVADGKVGAQQLLDAIRAKDYERAESLAGDGVGAMAELHKVLGVILDREPG